MDASRKRTAVSFGYRGETRHLEPYAVMFRRGNWYVAGRDVDRDEIRSFRADRIDTEVAFGKERGFERPPDFDPEALLRDEPWRFGDEAPTDAVVRLDPAVAGWVVQRLGEPAVVDRSDDGYVTVRFTVTNREAFRSFVLGLLDHAVVLEPPELRDDIVTWLSKMAQITTGKAGA